MIHSKLNLFKWLIKSHILSAEITIILLPDLKGDPQMIDLCLRFVARIFCQNSQTRQGSYLHLNWKIALMFGFVTGTFSLSELIESLNS